MFNINLKQKIIYFRTRKTASSTITEVLRRYNIIQQIPAKTLDPMNKVNNFYDHTDPLSIKEIIKLEDFYKIVSIRDPLTMIKSWFFFIYKKQKLGTDVQNKFLKWLRKNNYSNIKFNDELLEYNDYDYIIRFESLKDDLIKILNKNNIYDYTILNEILESSKGEKINHPLKGKKNFDYNTAISFKKDIPK